MATHSNILAWEIPWTKESGGPQSMGSQRIGHHLVTKPPTYTAELRRRSSGKRQSGPLLCVPPAPAERRLGGSEEPSSVFPLAAAAAGRWACSPAALRPIEELKVRAGLGWGEWGKAAPGSRRAGARFPFPTRGSPAAPWDGNGLGNPTGEAPLLALCAAEPRRRRGRVTG